MKYEMFKDFVTCGQMRVLERRADADGLSYYQMMENAGTGAAEIIMERHAYVAAIREDTASGMEVASKAAEALRVLSERSNPGNRNDLDARSLQDDRSHPNETPASRGSVFLFCGKGNNGGDGFVAARLMCSAGYDVTVILVDGEPKTDDSKTNFELLKKLPVRILDMHTNDRALMELGTAPDIIVDAIYGTGFHGSLRGNGLKAAIYINRLLRKDPAISPIRPVMVFALDIPSGMGGDMLKEKELDTNCVTAHHTITFHACKPVHLKAFAKPYCGEIHVVDIGIDAERLWYQAGAAASDKAQKNKT